MSSHKVFDFFLGLSAISAAGGMGQMGAGAAVSGAAAHLNAVSQAVASGLLPKPPRAPAPLPMGTPLWGSPIRRQWKAEMARYQHEMNHWHNLVAITFGGPQ